VTDLSESRINAIWRIESSRLIATLTRMTGDVSVAEDLAQEAFIVALEKWPTQGVPDNPGAWLMATAKRKAIDLLRRDKMLDRKHEELGVELGVQQEERFAAVQAGAEADDQFGDDLLRLVFTTCHPVLPKEARVALTLRLLGGLTTPEIARAFLVPEATLAQRIVRAKKTLSDSKVPFEAPRGAELMKRLAAVLEVIYLVFNEGYSATAGDDWVRPALCEDALRLGRIVAELLPDEAEVHGLVALLELQASRLRARVGPKGEAVLLEDQDRARWDYLLIGRGLAGLERAASVLRSVDLIGPYQLQAEIAACHARARVADDTDWQRIASLYYVLAEVMPSPIVELNRAVAVAMAEGPEVGLEIVDELAGVKALESYHLLPAVRGHLLAKMGRGAEARAEFERAASLTENERDRAIMMRRASESA
jgi:RNA polymerase sigma-70 factor, ECF subfamily